MTAAQYGLLLYVLGVVCGVALAMLVRPYDFKDKDAT